MIWIVLFIVQIKLFCLWYRCWTKFYFWMDVSYISVLLKILFLNFIMEYFYLERFSTVATLYFFKFWRVWGNFFTKSNKRMIEIIHTIFSWRISAHNNLVFQSDRIYKEESHKERSSAFFLDRWLVYSQRDHKDKGKKIMAKFIIPELSFLFCSALWGWLSMVQSKWCSSQTF